MIYGRRDLFVTEPSQRFPRILACEEPAEPSDCDETEVRDILDEATSETVYGIVLFGPFAGPFVVEIIRYTSMHMRTKYFWNGHSMLRKELYLCGDSLSAKRVRLITEALSLGVQFDNSTVPMIVTDLTSGGQSCPSDLSSHNLDGEATLRFLRNR